MEIKLESKDIKYFHALDEKAQLLEKNIAALDIEKFEMQMLYREVKAKLSEFSKQIRVKYEVNHPDALIDLERGVIEIPVPVAPEIPKKEEVVDELIEGEKPDDVPPPPPPPPKCIIAEDVEMPKKRKKLNIKEEI